MVLAVAGAAWAHGEISPCDARESVVEVPNELYVPTTEARLVVPEGFEGAEVDEPGATAPCGDVAPPGIMRA